MGEVIGLVSLKGGVGKTTLAAALGSELANAHGKKVLLVDANYSAPNLGIHMNIISPGKTIHDVLSGNKLSAAVHDRYGVHVVPGNFLFKRDYSPMKLRNKLGFARKKYDFVILDASPNLDHEVMSTILASDKLFLVTTPDYAALSCAMKVSKFAKSRNKEISGIIVNRYRGKKYGVSLEEIQESTGIPVVAMIRDDKRVAKALFERMPANLTKGNFSREVGRLGQALAGVKESRPFWKKATFVDMDKEEVNREVLKESFYKSVFKK